ncbi:MAG: DUF488 domain-containing protein [Fimbriimonadaceae bacterium]|nr:DUF488 domain-containing protein [Fimbriimonadaceae bacterium]
MPPLFTIGHSNHDLEAFLALLRQHAVGHLVDVRSSPYSAWATWFNREALAAALRAARVDYTFAGAELGARRSEAGIYRSGRASYTQIAALPAFRQGLARVLACAAEQPTALLCAEADPATCHRAVLVARELDLLAERPPLSHILGSGELETQRELGQRLVRMHRLQYDLFELTDEASLVARAFELQGQKIAHRREEEPAE